MTHWWRAYDDAIDNPKLLKLSDAMHRAWFTLQCIASANGGALPPTDDVATRLRMKPAKVAEWITALVRARLIDNCDGVFRPHNWDDRQFQSDSSTPRVKRFREKKRNVSGNVSGNVSVTAYETAPEQSRADSEAEQSRADASAPVDEDLKRKASALGAAISAHFISRNQPIPNLDRCLLWLSQGYAQGTILGAVERVLKRGKPVSTLDYFDGAIKDDHVKASQPSPLSGQVIDLSRINWDATVKLWKGNQSIWPRGIGGEPGQFGCKCPANILAANLIDPGNGRIVSQPLIFISQGTPEMAAHCTEAQIQKRKPPCIFEFEEDGTIKTGAFVSQAFPNGWDSSTGERIAPANSEVSAA